MPAHPTPSKKCARYFTCRIGMTTLWSACAAVCRVNKWFADDVLHSVKGEFLPKSDFIMLNWQHLLDGMIPKHHQDLFATPAFPAQGLSTMLVSPGKGLCRHHRFARALARCHCKWVPGRLIGLGVRSFRLKILQQTPFLLWIVKSNGFLIIKYLWFVNFKYTF